MWTERDHERCGQAGSYGRGNERQFHENVALNWQFQYLDILKMDSTHGVH